eukprot:m.173481 g.173481  ORF g.173481 m.173481 type:complete len:211 (-) comp18301_c0_seq2:340-972(-)
MADQITEDSPADPVAESDTEAPSPITTKTTCETTTEVAAGSGESTEATTESTAETAADDGGSIDSEIPSKDVAIETPVDENDQASTEILDLGTLPNPVANAKAIKVDMPATRFLLDDLEKDATKLADSIAHVSGSLKINLHALTTMCGQYIDAHKLAVDSVGEVGGREVFAHAPGIIQRRLWDAMTIESWFSILPSKTCPRRCTKWCSSD